MSFLRTLSDQEASGEVADVYDQERKERGFVMEATRALTTRPEVLLAWERFTAVARDGGFTLSRRDLRSAGLPERDVAMLEYAEKVTVAAHTVTEDDIQRLRQQGFSDEQIFDIALCAAVRNFFSRLIDAVGALPDHDLQGLEPADLRAALMVGRQVG